MQFSSEARPTSYWEFSAAKHLTSNFDSGSASHRLLAPATILDPRTHYPPPEKLARATDDVVRIICFVAPLDRFPMPTRVPMIAVHPPYASGRY